MRKSILAEETEKITFHKPAVVYIGSGEIITFHFRTSILEPTKRVIIEKELGGLCLLVHKGELPHFPVYCKILSASINRDSLGLFEREIKPLKKIIRVLAEHHGWRIDEE